MVYYFICYLKKYEGLIPEIPSMIYRMDTDTGTTVFRIPSDPNKNMISLVDPVKFIDAYIQKRFDDINKMPCGKIYHLRRVNKSTANRLCRKAWGYQTKK